MWLVVCDEATVTYHVHISSAAPTDAHVQCRTGNIQCTTQNTAHLCLLRGLGR